VQGYLAHAAVLVEVEQHPEHPHAGLEGVPPPLVLYLACVEELLQPPCSYKPGESTISGEESCSPQGEEIATSVYDLVHLTTGIEIVFKRHWSLRG
jgi:hypothetical protein